MPQMRIGAAFTVMLLLAGCNGIANPQSGIPRHVGKTHMRSLIQQLRNLPTRFKESNTARANHDLHAELDALLAKLIPLFINAAPAARSQVRQAAASDRKLEDSIRNYAARASVTLHSGPNDDMYARLVARGNVPVVANDSDELFRLGLGALAIENCADYRESMTALAELCIRGEQAGVVPRRHLDELAPIFSDKLIGGFGNEERPYKMVVRDFRKSKSSSRPWWKFW